MKKKETKSKFDDAKNWLFMLKFIFSVNPSFLILSFAANTLIELSWSLPQVVLLKYVIDIVSEGARLYRVAAALACYAGFVLLANTFNVSFWEIGYPILKEKLHRNLYAAIYEKAVETDLSAYDDPSFYNDFVLSMNVMGSRVEDLISFLRDMFTELCSVAVLSGVLATIDPICLLIVFASAATAVPLGMKSAAVSAERTEKMTPIDRKKLYYSRVFYLADYAKELRLYPAGQMIRRRYDENISDRLRVISPYLKKQALLDFLTASIPQTIAIELIVMLYLGWRAIVRGDLTTGDFAAAFNGLNSISFSVYFVTMNSSWSVRENSLYVNQFKRFMQTEKKIKSGENRRILDRPETIRLEHVSFTYPGNDSPALKNIDLEIKPCQKIALVGYNGAGKTTLTHLLLRLYDVTDGAITVGGEDIRSWDADAYHANFAAVFQDYSLFGATVGENVAMAEDPDPERAARALRESGFQRELPNGADTVLLKEFDENGTELSGGEAQKIAIARAFYKKCPFAILDEPSANLDPQAEYSLNEAMARAAKDKTVIFISHRLSTTVMADVIYMLENGEIVESGTHDELMAKNGKYAYMFRLQAEKYAAGGETPRGEP